MSQTIIDLLKNGEKANYSDEFRSGNLVNLPANGSLIIAGDIHGHRRNFERIVSFADLKNNPQRHVMLQEVIHGGPEDGKGGCLSYQLLFKVIQYKLKYPHRVHFIMGNHALAFVSDTDIMKDGKEMNRAMSYAMEREFKDDYDNVKQAMKHFFYSLPLAVRCKNRIWASHSLPSDNLIDKFDPKIMNRQLKISDFEKRGSAYVLTWGRRHSQALYNRMARFFDVDIFVLGHQPQEKGSCQTGKNTIILASDHDHGCLLEIDLTKSYTIDELIGSILPLASIA